MKTRIIYFSGTGNTKYLSGKLGESMEVITGDNVEVISIEEALNTEVESQPIMLGLGYPVYDYKPPQVFVKMLEKYLRKQEVIGAFIFGTYATAALDANAHMMKLLDDKGIPVYGQTTFKAPGAISYLYVHKHNPLANKQRIFSTNIREQVKAFAESVQKHIIKDLSLVPIKFNKLNHYHQQFSNALFGNLFYKGLKVSEGCTGCGVCTKLCPVDNLRLLVDKVQIIDGDQCEHCLKCVVNCPKKAINFTVRKRHGDYKPAMIDALYHGI